LLTDNLGAQSAVGAGGRYDGLVKQLGGPDVPGIGFALGLERLALLMEQQGLGRAGADVDIFIAALGTEALEQAFVMVHALRKIGLQATMDHQGRSLKNQMKQAGRMMAAHTLIMGEEELNQNQAILRNMKTREQQDIDLSADLSAWAAGLKKLIKPTN
jgi:histidyl-tRNA synthetase